MEMGYLNGSHEHGVRGRGGPMARGRGGPPPPRYVITQLIKLNQEYTCITHMFALNLRNGLSGITFKSV